MTLQVGQGEFVFSYVCDGDPEPMSTIIGYDATGDFADPTVEAAEAMHDLWGVVTNSLQSADYDLVSTTMRMAVIGGTVEAVHSGVVGGGEVDDAVPQNTAFLIRKLTGGVGQGKNGRLYLPGVPETDVDHDGVLGSAVVSDANLVLLDFWNAISISDDVPSTVVNHGPTNLTSFDYILSFVLDPLVATQRRRLRR